MPRRNILKNYSSIKIDILGKVHDNIEVSTYTKEFVFNNKGEYFKDHERKEMNIPDEEVIVLNNLIKSGFLNSPELKYEVIFYINEQRSAIGMNKLVEHNLWNDLCITAIVTQRQRKKDTENASKNGRYKLQLLNMENLEIIKVSILGEIEETDPEHGISITFLNNKVARISQEMDYQFHIT